MFSFISKKILHLALSIFYLNFKNIFSDLFFFPKSREHMKVNLSSDQFPLNKCVFFKGLILSKFSNESHRLDMAKKNVCLKVLLVLVSLFCGINGKVIL